MSDNTSMTIIATVTMVTLGAIFIADMITKRKLKAVVAKEMAKTIQPGETISIKSN